jgi:hypothetical protein
MVVAFMGINLAHSESQKGKWKKLENVLGGGAVGHWGEEGVLL